MNYAGFLYGALEHHLDHLAPLCSLLQVPLILTEEELWLQAQLYYPHLETIFFNCLEAPFETVQRFDTIFCTTPRPMIDEVFFIAEQTLKKKIKTIWLPHGNSEKGRSTHSATALKNEELLLVYGPKMVDFFRECNFVLPKTVMIGNFRKQYYEQHRPFYESLIDLPNKTTLLYAPTWEDDERSSSFFTWARKIIEELPDDLFLMIKLHPNLENDPRTVQLMLQYELHPNLRFLKRFAPIYPILQKSDIYLGDASSIGYDFLTFDRPMFFISESQTTLDLHQCGRVVLPQEDLFTVLRQDQAKLSCSRKAMYDYTFGKKPWDLKIAGLPSIQAPLTI